MTRSTTPVLSVSACMVVAQEPGLGCRYLLIFDLFCGAERIVFDRNANGQDGGVEN
jgi:hypothetical protein